MQAHVWQKIMFICDVIAIFLTSTCFNSPQNVDIMILPTLLKPMISAFVWSHPYIDLHTIIHTTDFLTFCNQSQESSKIFY